MRTNVTSMDAIRRRLRSLFGSGSSTAKDQWHRAIVTKRSGRLTIAVDGKIVLQNAPVPGLDRSGRIALRHDGRSVEFANVFVRE